MVRRDASFRGYKHHIGMIDRFENPKELPNTLSYVQVDWCLILKMCNINLIPPDP